MNRKWMLVSSGVVALGLFAMLAVPIAVPAISGAEESQAKMQAEQEEWNRQLATKVSDGTKSWGAIEIVGDAEILKVEAVKLDVEKVVDASDSAASAKRKAFKGQYELKIYLSDGSVQTVGPFAEKPKRTEVTSVNVFGKSSKAILIEE